jgi:hypothetical protein
MNAYTSREEARAPRLDRQQAADLISRYPHVSEGETKLILRFLRTGRHLDVGMLTADENLKPQLDSFMADHSKDLRVSFVEGAAVVAAITGFLLVCWLIWEAVKPAALVT